ncbi:phage tail protein [Parasulfitobacter algicola]|uniref:Phage tail protein n=1 Tax=Parasulfitobacter algicola TaxID=2614809 RepID=A0ABX2ITW0_9RHOB|nr:phage tail protein [Sulfitobacter algicola]NSX55760.1 phage tail protein [Sulfitobacter algicola]
MPLEMPGNSYNFRLDIGGEVVGVFTDVTPPSARVESIEYREGGGAPAVRVLPGRVIYDPVVLRWGFGLSPVLWTWMTASMAGRAEYKDIALIMIGNDGEMQTGRYNMFRCLPTACSMSELSALSQSVSIESLEIRYENLERILA